MVRFDGFELDEATRQLRRDGQPIHLEPQAFDVLVHLVVHRDRVVPKEELLEQVWGHTFVSESALTTRIKEVRRAVGDDGTRQAVVANVRGRGYRFVAELAQDPAGPEAAVLVGRGRDVDGVLERLAHERLVTVVGPGGVGKTTLATEVAHQWRAAQGRPALVVALAEVTDPESVAPALAEVTGVMADGDDTERLVDALADRDELVVLDNCEHVLDVVAELTARLLRSGGVLRVLATSRERLGLGTEHVWPLLPLDGDDARRLFVARAEAAGATVDATDPRIGRIVDALDGLPLALEMAAAQLPVMTGEDLEALIDEGAELLRSPDRSAPARHRTLGALVRWSLDLLTTPERDVLTGLSVFAGSATAPDAAAVLADVDHGAGADTGADTGAGTARIGQLAMAGTLAALASRSLLAAETDRATTRYRLPETVKAVVGRELPGSRRAVLARRHAEHFLEVARSCDAELRSPSEVVGHERLTDAIPELRAASRWSCEHRPALVTELSAALHLFTYSRLWAEPAQWARSLGRSDDPVLVAVLAADAANRSRLDEAIRLAERALGADDRRARAIAREVLGDASLYQGRLDAAEAHARALQELGAVMGDSHLQVVGLVNVALARSYGDHPSAAAQAIEEMRRLEPELAPSDQGWCDYVEGEVSARDDPRASNLALVRAIDLAEMAGNRLLASVARTSLATGLVRAGELDAALDAYATCVREAVAHGNSTHAATILRNLVELLVAEGDTETASVLLGAVDAEGVKTTYGDEARRLDSARAAVGAGDTAGTVGAWLARGEAIGLDGALSTALRAIERRRGD